MFFIYTDALNIFVTFVPLVLCCVLDRRRCVQLTCAYGRWVLAQSVPR